MTKSGDGMMDKEMKSERITLRVSPREKEEIEKKAAQENMSVSKYLIYLTKSEKSLVTDHVADFFLDITRVSVCIEHLVKSVAWKERVNNGKLCEIRDLMDSIYNNTSEIFKILKKEDDETKNNTDQYKRISKQLDKLIELVSEDNTQI